MAKEYVLTMTAANRAGILAAVTRSMSELGGDLREVSQTVVRGYFTMIFSAEFPDDLSEKVIRGHIEDACRPYGIDLGLKDPEADLPPTQARETATVHTLRLGGDNNPGVLKNLSTVISMQQVDIVGMRAIRARQGAGFEMVMKVAIPHGNDVQSLIHAMTQSGEDCQLTVDEAGAG